MIIFVKLFFTKIKINVEWIYNIIYIIYIGIYIYVKYIPEIGENSEKKKSSRKIKPGQTPACFNIKTKRKMSLLNT